MRLGQIAPLKLNENVVIFPNLLWFSPEVIKKQKPVRSYGRSYGISQK
jgi:hypothetical protein